jgi:hypothetical protein
VNFTFTLGEQVVMEKHTFRADVLGWLHVVFQ